MNEAYDVLSDADKRAKYAAFDPSAGAGAGGFGTSGSHQAVIRVGVTGFQEFAEKRSYGR